MREKSARGGAKMSTSWLSPELTCWLVWIEPGGMTVTDGPAQNSCSSCRQWRMSVPQGQRMWWMKEPSSTREHCSKSAWTCGDILPTSRGPMRG